MMRRHPCVIHELSPSDPTRLGTGSESYAPGAAVLPERFPLDKDRTILSPTKMGAEGKRREQLSAAIDETMR